MAINNIIIPIPFTKRFFDICISLIFIFFSLPIFLLILFALFLEHVLNWDIFEPLFYYDLRISQGKPFYLIKFNIFNPKALYEMQKKSKIVHTKILEKQINGLTNTGYLLKQIYMDELPQVFNVLIGDMSMVGPRPVNLEVYHNQLAQGIICKKIIKAGLTGNFQSLKGATKKTDKELDQEYIEFCRHHSSWEILLLDIKILFRTIKLVLKAQGI